MDETYIQNNAYKVIYSSTCTCDSVCVPIVAHHNGLLKSIEFTVLDYIFVDDRGSRLAYIKKHPPMSYQTRAHKRRVCMYMYTNHFTSL